MNNNLQIPCKRKNLVMGNFVQVLLNGFDKNNTERQIMLDREIHRIYDCGTKKYSKIIN